MALLVRRLLDHLNLRGYPKLSGATGIHIHLPLVPRHPHPEVVQKELETVRPRDFTLETIPARLDRLQAQGLKDPFHPLLTERQELSARALPG